MKIAIIDKAPSRNDYSKYFDFDYEHFHMSSVPLAKMLKKDIDLEIDLDYYDFVILVGAEAAKNYAKITSVTNYAGQLVKDKFLCMSNPAMLIFKPEGKNDFERSVDKIKNYINGSLTNIAVEGDFKGIDTTEEALEFLHEVLQNAVDRVAMDSETTALYPRDGYVLGISISYKKQQGRYILSDILNDECLELLQQIVDKFTIIFHNMKFDIKMISYHLGIKFREDAVEDTILMHYVLDENAPHGLKQLALKYTNYGDYDAPLEEFKKEYCSSHGILQDDFTYDLIPFEIMWLYASIDTAVTFELREKFYPLIWTNAKLLSVYNNILIPGTLFLNDMEEVGIPISEERMVYAEQYLDEEIIKAREKIYEFEEIKTFEQQESIIFNPNSVQQLRKVLFDYLKLTPTGKLTATGALSTDAEVLEELSKEHPLPASILKVRQLTKIKNTYISKILPELNKDGRIRTNFNLIFTTSGRLSSSGKFNAQQIPRDDPLVKGCIVAPEGYSIVSQDLQTGEMYYAAVLSGDKNLQQVFKDGGDFHSSIAKMVFDLNCAVEAIRELYPGLRQSAKAISFGILYGSGPQKVSDTVSEATGEYYGIDRAKEDINAYFTKFSKLKKWLNSRKKFIEDNGYTYSFFGRKRRLINVFSADKGIAAHEVRSGINAEVQSLCSDINLLGAIDTSKEIRSRGLRAHIFMLVHDSIVSLVHDDDVKEFCEILKRNTQKDRGCSIPGCPIGVDQEIGKDYSFGKFDKTYHIVGNRLSRI
jgi:DNA polymerase I-like protein with 3'-5' exonuclease and polymerase domains